jgi:hypothetical protein
MILDGSVPNSVTIISLLSACASLGALSQGMEIHSYSLKKCLLSLDNDFGGDGEYVICIENIFSSSLRLCYIFLLLLRLYVNVPPKKSCFINL